MSHHFELPLDIFGQDPETAYATPFLFLWPLQDNEGIAEIVARLQVGLEVLVKAVPWVAGRVVWHASSSNDAYPYKIVPLGPTPHVVVHDYRHALDAPSMGELMQKKFPIGLLDESVLSPVNVLPGATDEKRDAVLTIQFTRLRGGLAVNIVGNHQVLDGTGQEQLIYLLDKACRGQAFDAEEIATANLDRTTIIRPFDSDWQSPVDTMYVKPVSSGLSVKDSGVQGAKPAYAWVNWAFSKLAQMELKAIAMQQLSVDFVSTDDVLTACIWQALARARIGRLGPGVKSTMGRSVNPRRYLDIPATYPGYVANDAFSKLSLQEVVESPLGGVASILRAAVHPRTSDLRNTTREFATLLHRATDKSTVSKGACLDLDSDLMVSSWANMRCNDFTFGFGLGTPSAFRRPQHAIVPSLIFLLPRCDDGEVVVTMCTRVDDLSALRVDKEWARFAEYIG